jgi:hypothetical protein
VVACTPMRQNMRAYRTVTNNPCAHINAELLLVSTQYSSSSNPQNKCFRMHVDMDIFFLFWYVELVPKFCLHLSVGPCLAKLRDGHETQREELKKGTWSEPKYISEPTDFNPEDGGSMFRRNVCIHPHNYIVLQKTTMCDKTDASVNHPLLWIQKDFTNSLVRIFNERIPSSAYSCKLFP